jgi:hypothetical protein
MMKKSLPTSLRAHPRRGPPFSSTETRVLEFALAKQAVWSFAHGDQRVNDALDLIYVLVCRKRAIVEAATHFHHHVLLALCIRTVSDAKGCESDD